MTGRVRGVVEGEITDDFARGTMVKLGSESDEHGPDYVLLKRLTDVQHIEPEPEWQMGDVVRDRHGCVWMRRLATEHPVWGPVYGPYQTYLPPQPLTLLVRDGKPVQP